MANLKFTSDIIDDVLFRAGEPVDGTSDFETQTLEYTNRAYRAMWMGGGEFDPEISEDWLWLLKSPPGLLLLVSPITAGTVAVTGGSAAITFSSPPAASVANYHFKVTGHSDIFRVLSHTGGAGAATLDQAYTGATNGAAAYTVAKLEYDLAADLLKLMAPLRCAASRRGEIGMVDLFEVERDLSRAGLEAVVPTRFGMLTNSKIRFNKGAQSAVQTRVEYDYLQLPADLTNSASEEPLVPLQYRQVLADIALFYLLLAKSDNRADAVSSMARAGLRAMVQENRALMSRRKQATLSRSRLSQDAKVEEAVKQTNG